jgi:hypothetical protein
MEDPDPPSSNPERARAAFLKAIEEQIRSSDPPETKQTYERLMKAGYSRNQTLKLIASALMAELYGVLKSDSPYDHARYVANLNKLPRQPWEK